MIVKLNDKDITKLVESLNITNSIDSLSTTVSITLPHYNNTKFTVDVYVGDKITIDDIFNGIVVDTVYNEHSTNIKCFDISFYLSKNIILKQFRKTSAKEAIKVICSELEIPINIKSGLNTKLNMFFKNKSASEAVWDIIKEDTKQTAKKYFIYTQNNVVNIEELGSDEILLSYRLNEDDTFTDYKLFSDINVTNNIEELKNSIIVTSDNEKSLKILAKAEDKSSIEKYGKIQTVIELNSKENKKSQKVAQTNLDALNKINKVININLISDKYIVSGKKIKFENKYYLINSVNLNFENGHFKGSLELKGVV